MPSNSSHLITISGVTAGMSWLPQLDLFLRIGASSIAIVTGIIWIYYKLRYSDHKAD